MEINVSDQTHIVEIWLTNQEQQDEDVKKAVLDTARCYSRKKYKVAVFKSGNSDLFDCTDGLIKHNLRL